jgi:predicted Zn-dependent protease
MRRRGLASRAVDGEGLPVQRRALIDRGVLTNWILDLRSARKLNLAPTGQGGRGGPSTSNVHMEAGTRSPEEMMKAIGSGFLVTEFIGSSVNMVTGDYSRGASGYWIERRRNQPTRSAKSPSPETCAPCSRALSLPTTWSSAALPWPPPASSAR